MYHIENISTAASSLHN